MRKEISSLIKQVLKTFLVLCIFLIVPSLLFLLLKNYNFDYGIYNNLLVNIFIFLLLILIFSETLISDFKDFKKNAKKYIKISLKYYILGFLIMIISNFIINFIIFNGSISGNEEAVRKALIEVPIIGLFLGGFVAPIIEELVFRKNFKDLFKNNIWIFAFVSTFVFAGLHVMTDFKGPLDLLYFIPYGALGFAFCITYYKTNNIYSSILMHVFHNTFVFSLLIMASKGFM